MGKGMDFLFERFTNKEEEEEEEEKEKVNSMISTVDFSDSFSL